MFILLFVKPGAKRGHSGLFRPIISNFDLSMQKIIDYKLELKAKWDWILRKGNGGHSVTSVGLENLKKIPIHLIIESFFFNSYDEVTFFNGQ